MASNLDKAFKANKTSEETGVWFMISETTGFLVKRFNESNPALKQTMAKHFKPYARQMEMGTLGADKEREIMTKVFVYGCLQDWQGIEIDGATVAYSPEAALKLLNDLPDLFAVLHRYSQDFANYKAYRDESEEDLGNS